MCNLPGNLEVVAPWTSPNGQLSFPAITVKSFNSQVAEQANAKLSANRSQVSYMRQEHNLAFVTYFLYKKNQQLRW